ncbi:ATP-binding protein [Streptomyces sp. H10-C2]|uniref:ATP-binding protein n=1 Tax=unclassified Streptomyces TaxID=2593676 RepID=UPI0024BB2745|nr:MULTISPECIES: ATP-binding protein [unclassified Streptomyces]MDJ0344352.1 ATP-binding protein [Streptomyces sp. PH10-H1]MDJ0373721.1 ATP-binding protein [Streptomyces sp. H10-C2]
MNLQTPTWPPDGRALPHSYTLFCPPLITSPCIARDFVASVLRSLGLHRIIDAAEVCASELVTNAYQHAKGVGSLLWLAVEGSYIRITVYDGTPDPPVVVPEGCEEEGGRGLLLVAALADDWGTVKGAPLGPVAGEGKGVWFALATAV